MTQIVDLIRYRLKRELMSSGEIAVQSAPDLLELYDAGAINVTFKEGEMFLSLSDWAAKGMDDGALIAALLGPQQEPDQ